MSHSYLIYAVIRVEADDPSLLRERMLVSEDLCGEHSRKVDVPSHEAGANSTKPTDEVISSFSS